VRILGLQFPILSTSPNLSWLPSFQYSSRHKDNAYSSSGSFMIAQTTSKRGGPDQSLDDKSILGLMYDYNAQMKREKVQIVIRM